MFPARACRAHPRRPSKLLRLRFGPPLLCLLFGGRRGRGQSGAGAGLAPCTCRVAPATAVVGPSTSRRRAACVWGQGPWVNLGSILVDRQIALGQRRWLVFGWRVPVPPGLGVGWLAFAYLLVPRIGAAHGLPNGGAPRSSRRLTASRLAPGERCAYRIVSSIRAWPRSCWTAWSGTPRITRRDAKVWR